MTNQSSKPMLTVQQIAAELQVQQQAVLRWIHSGQLEAINAATSPGSRALWRIEPGAYRRFLDGRRAGSGGLDTSADRNRTAKPRRRVNHPAGSHEFV